MRSPHRCLYVAAAVCAAALLAPKAFAEKTRDVNVVVDMSPAGRLVAPPSPGHPVYFLPLVEGYRQQGDPYAGEKVSTEDVGRFVNDALARLGYLPALNPKPYFDKRKKAVTYADGTVVTVPAKPVPGQPLALNVEGNVPLTMAALKAPSGPYSMHDARNYPTNTGLPALVQVLMTTDPVHGSVMNGLPTQIIVVHWGSANPNKDDVSKNSDNATKRFMLALIAGNAIENLNEGWTSDEMILQDAEFDQYFVVVSAYDFAKYERERKKVLLWQAKMSVPSNGLKSFDEVAYTLVKAGAPFFGSETKRPKQIDLPVTPEGKVIIGEPVVKEYRDAPVAPPPQAQPSKRN